MWKKATIGGVVAVALVGGGAGAAIAATRTGATPASSTATPTATATTSASATKAKNGAKKADGAAAQDLLGKLQDLQHAEWVSKSGANTYVTHDAILGQVTAVSASSITVKAADGTSLTFAVDAATKVRPLAVKAKAGKKASATSTGTSTGTSTASPTASPTTSAATPTATIADVTVGQTVLVSGAKSPDLTAKAVFGRS